MVRFAEAAEGTGLRTLYGAELSLGLPEPQLGVPDPVGEHLLVLARGQEGYRRLSRQISRAQLAGGEKGRPVYDLDTLTEAADGHWLILTGCRKGSVRRGTGTPTDPDAAGVRSVHLVDRFGRDNVVVELTRSTRCPPTTRTTTRWPRWPPSSACRSSPPPVRTTPAPARAGWARRWPRSGPAASLDEADPYLPAGPSAHLRSGAEMAALFARYPTAVPTAARLGAECAFDLKLVAPNLPPFEVPPGEDENDVCAG